MNVTRTLSVIIFFFYKIKLDNTLPSQYYRILAAIVIPIFYDNLTVAAGTNLPGSIEIAKKTIKNEIEKQLKK